MVSEMSLVQRLDPQWTTPVTKGTSCKETADIPAWPTVSGVGGHQLAVVRWYCIYAIRWCYIYLQWVQGDSKRTCMAKTQRSRRTPSCIRYTVLQSAVQLKMIHRVLCHTRTVSLRWARLNNQSRHAQNKEHCYRNSICLHSTQHIMVVCYIR